MGILCKTQHKSFPWLTARQGQHKILPLYSKEKLQFYAMFYTTLVTMPVSNICHQTSS